MSYCPSLPFWEVYVACALAGCSTNTLEPDSLPPPAPAQSSVTGDTLTAVADAHLRSAAKNLNSGTSQTIPVKITVGEADTTRAIIKFDQAAIVAALGSRTLTGATLELAVKESGTDPAGNDIDVHRVLKPWTEVGVTWKCGEDLNTANVGADCPTTKWKMDGADMDAFVATHTARVHLNPGQIGLARFDVTSDVQAFLAGQGNHGWVVNAGSASSRALLWSREAALKPRLILAVTGSQTPADWPQLTELAVLDTTRLVTLPNDTAQMYRTELVIAFDENISDASKQSILNSFGFTVIGVTAAGRFFVRFSDRGPSYEAYHAFVDSVRARPGIRNVALINFTPLEEQNFSRYPSDGPGQARTDWFTSTDHTWAQRALRLPLAWGCENGEYGGAAVPVGVLEWKHAPNHPEFAASSPVLREPNDAELAGTRPHPAASIAARQLHATQVVGMLTAKGENDAGVAGVMWKTNLHLYAIYSPGNRPIQLQTQISRITDRVRLDGIRVLSISVDGNLARGLSLTDKEQIIEDVAIELRFLLDASPGLTIVKAAGNHGLSTSYEQYVLSESPAVLGSALMAVKQEPRFRDRVLLVTGSQQGNQHWSSGNVFFGVTDIAAPARNLVTLDRWTGQPLIPVTAPDVEGTSFAAPMVAGVAAQLLAMEPTLSPDQVKDYILRGTQLPKEDPATGNLVPAAPVSGVSEPVYQLDAYGALTLLSRERPGTPLCGVEVVTQHNSALGETRMIANRASPEILIPDQPASLGAFSVAQGGRLFAVQDASNGGTIPYQLTAGAWQAQTPITDAERVIYLERDTAYLRTQFGGRFDLQVRLNAGNWATVTAGLPSGTSFAQYSIPFYSQPVSPTGDYIYAIWGWANGPCVDTLDVQAAGGGAYRIPLRGSGAPVAFYTFSEPNTCDFVHPTPSQQDHNVVWRRDGSELIRATWIGELGFAQLRRHGDHGNPASLVGTSTPVPEPSRIEHMDWSPEGGRLRARLLLMRSSTCILTARAVTALDQTVEPDRLVGWQECPRTPIIAPLRQGFLASRSSDAGGSPGGGLAVPASRPHVSPLRRTAPQEFRLWAN